MYQSFGHIQIPILGQSLGTKNILNPIFQYHNPIIKPANRKQLIQIRQYTCNWAPHYDFFTNGGLQVWLFWKVSIFT